MAKHGKRRIVESPQYIKLIEADTPWKRFCDLFEKTIKDNLYDTPNYSINGTKDAYIVEITGGLNDSDKSFIMDKFKQNLEDAGIQSQYRTKFGIPEALIVSKQAVADAFEPLITESVSKKKLTESYDEPLYFRAYITNLGKYNEGELDGEWVDFPIDERDFNEVLTRIEIGPQYEEWFVTDYDCNLNGFEWQELGEYPSFEKLQEFGQLVADITDPEAVSNAYEAIGDLQEAIEGLENGDIYYYAGVSNWDDWGQYIVSNIYGDDVASLGVDEIERYFDYSALGRELNLDSWGEDSEMSAGEYWCGDEDASDSEIGETYVEEVGFEGVANPENYFDYEAFGRDNGHDCTFTSDGLVEQVG